MQAKMNAQGVYTRPARRAKTGAEAHEEFKNARARELEERKKRAEQNEENIGEILPRKDNSIQVVKVYEFQFYDNFEQLVQLGQQIKKLIDNFELVPESTKAQYLDQLSTGFQSWSFTDYQQFFKAFRKREIDDIEGIASEIDSKSLEEVDIYLRVFCQRFREVKERDLVILKFQKKDFEQQNLETILGFDTEKAARGEYIVLL